jgi:RNA polymerase subunit RPABC4/transcription elongation factor Spt4
LRCGRTPPKETKVCPVCDSTIDADARTCPSCLTDLSLFDVGGEVSEEAVDFHTTEGKSIDEILASIMEGRADQPEIFETLKSVGTSPPKSDDVVVETKPPEPAEPGGETPEAEEQFLCPVCDTVVRPEDTVCPGCGAEFSEGEATEYECPVCKAIVPADASHCPNCGVHFAPGAGEARETGPGAPEAEAAGPITIRGTLRSRIDSLREERASAHPELPTGDVKLMARELPRLVSDVKPLLVTAKRIGLDIEAGKRLINEAVQAGKKRDIDRAVRLIAEARQSLDVSFLKFIGGRLEAFVAEVNRAQGGAASSVDAQLEEAFANLRTGNYDAAWDTLQTALQGFMSQAKEYHEARGMLDGDSKLLVEVRGLGMDVQEVERLSKESREALDRRDADGASHIAKQAHERLLKDVPVFVDGQMKKARDILLDIKVRGGDVSKPVGMLKEAKAHAEKDEWDESLRFLREFFKEVGRGGRG